MFVCELVWFLVFCDVDVLVKYFLAYHVHHAFGVFKLVEKDILALGNLRKCCCSNGVFSEILMG